MLKGWLKLMKTHDDHDSFSKRIINANKNCIVYKNVELKPIFTKEKRDGVCLIGFKSNLFLAAINSEV